MYDSRGGPLRSGYFRDAETGLDYAMNRYHNPGTGRFMTPDPYMNSAGPTDPGSWNRYAYTRGDPVNRIDSNGTCDSTIDGIAEASCGYDGDPLSNFCVWGFIEPGDDLSGCPGGGPSYDAGPPQSTAPPPQVQCSISLYTRSAGGKKRPWKHTYIVVDDPLLTQSGYPSDELVLQAGPSNNFPIGGTLTSEIITPGQPGSFGSNKGNASNPTAPGNKEIGAPYSGANACNYILELLSAIGNYDDSRQVPYAAVPFPFTGFYNSNSFTSTLLSDIGLSFGSPGFAPGWGPLYSVPGLVP
jgi:RHS repeat-associated protein